MNDNGTEKIGRLRTCSAVSDDTVSNKALKS